MNLTKASIVAVFLLSFLEVGCHSIKVVQTTAQADSSAIAVKTQERMDSIIREVRIRDAKRERERELEEARKQNPQNLIDSIKLGLADGNEYVGHGPTDSAWVYYREAEKIPTVIKEVFPNVFFFEKCEVLAMPMSCFIYGIFDKRIWGPVDFNQLSMLAGTKNMSDNKKVEAYVIWNNIAMYPQIEVLSITKENHLSSDSTRSFNYFVIVSRAINKYHYIKYVDGIFLDYARSVNGDRIY